MTKNLSLLGSTGSIGTQSLDVARKRGYRVRALSAFSNVKKIEEQIREFKPDVAALVSEDAAKDLKDVYVKKGIVVSGDVFVSSSELKDALQTEFNADCAEMEGAAIAHVCMLNKMPFLVIRAMSDKANGEAPGNFDEFVFEAAKNSKKLILNMLTK